MLKIVVVGCGYWGANHIKTLKALNVLAGVSDILPEKAMNLAEKYQTKAYEIQNVFSDPSIDAISLALPPECHAEYAIKAIKGGKDVFVEKPLSLDLKEAQKALDTATEYNKILMVGHLMLFHPAFEKLLELYESGLIGDLSYLYANRLGFGKFHKKSDALWDLAPHDLAMILAISKEIPIKSQMIGTALSQKSLDFAHIHMQFHKGFASHLFVSRFSPYIERKLVLTGTKGMLIFDDLKDWSQKIMFKNYDLNRDENPASFCLGDKKYYPVREAMPLTREFEHFLKVIKTRQIPRTNAADAFKILKILKNAI